MKKLKHFLLAGAITLAILSPFAPDLAPLKAQERIALTAPAFVDAGAGHIKVVFLQYDWDNASVIVGVRATDANAIPLPTRQRVDFNYSGNQASNILRIINTNNFSTVSMHRRILNRLTSDGHISGGVIAGTPE